MFGTSVSVKKRGILYTKTFICFYLAKYVLLHDLAAHQIVILSRPCCLISGRMSMCTLNTSHPLPAFTAQFTDQYRATHSSDPA